MNLPSSGISIDEIACGKINTKFLKSSSTEYSVYFTRSVFQWGTQTLFLRFCSLPKFLMFFYSHTKHTLFIHSIGTDLMIVITHS